MSNFKKDNFVYKGTMSKTFEVSLPMVKNKLNAIASKISEGSLVMSLQYLRKKRRNADKVSSTITTYLPFLSLIPLGNYFQVQK